MRSTLSAILASLRFVRSAPTRRQIAVMRLRRRAAARPQRAFHAVGAER
jgi:hypothetical protein